MWFVSSVQDNLHKSCSGYLWCFCWLPPNSMLKNPWTMLKNHQLCDIQFPKHLSKGVRLSEKNKWKFSSLQPSESFTWPASRKAKCSAQASPPCQLWHTQSDYLPFVSFAYQSHGNAWTLGDSFFCFPAFSIAPESCMHRIRLFAYVNCWAQNIPSCVSLLQTAAHTMPLSRHRTVYSQFIP